MKRLICLCGLILTLALAPAETRSDEQPKVPMTQTVLAEGVGTTGDEALKDAFRNAVRQVVGAVVDAETLIKNDELISDKVLTYSGGFVKKYDEISKKEDKGLIRIKIKAQVESKSVVAKLKAANVKVKDVDGKGLFAEVVTELDREKDAAALLKKAFEGFPQSCITATVIGKPEIVEKSDDKATVKLNVRVEPDLMAYKAFSYRLVSLLEKLAKSKGEFTAEFGKSESFKELPNLDAIGDGGFGNIDLIKEWVPIAFEGQGNSRVWKKNHFVIAVATSRTKAADKIDYRCFSMDPSLRSLVGDVASRVGHGKLQLLDSEGEAIVTERFPLPTLLASFGEANGIYELGLLGLRRSGPDYEYKSAKEKACLFFVSPAFFLTRTNKLGHQAAITGTVNLTLGLEELKSVKDAKCIVMYEE